MYQKPLLEETISFLTPSERKQEGIQFHERYSLSIYRILIVLFIGLILQWYLFDYRFALLFGLFVLFLSISSEVFMKLFYGFSGRDATKYYAIKIYENPSEKNLKQLNSWNKNPFDLTTEYYYPRIGEIVEKSKQKNDRAEYVQSEIPDALRLIERRERDDYHTLVNINELDEQNINAYYEDLLKEVNYCYKFGAYTSVSMLLRKLTENLIEDILLTKGLYAELPKEPKFQEMVTVFVDEVLKKEYDGRIAEDLEESLDKWIRKKGNKGAHIPESFTQDEIQELMSHAQKTVRFLITIRSDLNVSKHKPEDGTE